MLSVPIQRGSSGGPVLDHSGNVIGVVVSKLDALKFAQRSGDLPQNVNFAIRGEFVRYFPAGEPCCDQLFKGLGGAAEYRDREPGCDGAGAVLAGSGGAGSCRKTVTLLS